MKHNYDLSLYTSFQYTKLEKSYQQSYYCGIHGVIIPLLALIYFAHQPVCLVIYSLIIPIYYKYKFRYRLIIRALLVVPLLFVKDSNVLSLFLNLMLNQALVPYWALQLPFFMISLRNVQSVYIMLLFAAIARYLEILKRNLYANAQTTIQESNTLEYLLGEFPQTIVKFDENLHLVYSNRKLSNLTQLFSNETIKQINEAMRKKQSDIVLSLQVESPEPIKQAIDFEFQIKDGIYQLIQLQFPTEGSLEFEKLKDSSATLYKLLCQDYQKWNNLRICKVVKESDMNVLSQCASDCLVLKNQIQTMTMLIQDTSFLGRQKFEEFHIKNYIGNLVEGMATKLFDHITVIDLQFDEAFPEFVKGDKTTLLYVLYVILYTLSLDAKRPIQKISSKTKIEERQLSINACISRVNDDKAGYDLEFTVSFSCTQQIAQLYSAVFHPNTQQSTNDAELLGMYMLQKCRHILKQLNHPLMMNLGKDHVAFQFGINIGICRRQASDTMVQASYDRGENIIYADLTFARTILDSNHWQWKIRQQASRNSVLQLQLSEISPGPGLNNQRSGSSISEAEDDVESEESLEVLMYPSLKENIVELMQELIQESYDLGLLDSTYIELEQSEDIITEVADRADSMQEYPESAQVSPPYFASPQPKPRKPITYQKSKLQKLVGKGLCKIGEPKGLNPSLIPPKQNRMSLFCSPNMNVSQKFMSSNSKQFHRKLNSHGVAIRSYKFIPDAAETKIGQHQQVYPTAVFKHKVTSQHREWIHQVRKGEPIEFVDETLCYIPSTQWIDLVTRFSSTKYIEKDRKCKPTIVYDMYELLEVYKEYLHRGKLFFFIMVYVKSAHEIVDCITAIRKIEGGTNKSFLVGWCDKTQINFSLQTYFNFVMPITQEDGQLKSSKIQIANMIDNN